MLDTQSILTDDAGKDGRVNEGKVILRMARRRYQKGCVFKRGRNWVLRYREDILNPDGRIGRAQRSIVLGPLDGKKAAWRAAENHLGGINTGQGRPQAAISFEDFWRRYFEREILPNRKYSTQQVYRYLAAKHLLPYFGRQRLCDISRLDVQTFIGQKQRQLYASKTLAHLRNLVSKIFAVAISWGWMNSNPASGVELPPRERRRESRVLALGEIAQLYGAFEEPMRTIFILGLLTGMRIGEILALRVEDVDLLGGILQVRRDVYRGHVQDGPKTKHRERRIPLAAFLIGAIRAWLVRRPAGSNWLFPSEAGTPFHERNLLRREAWPVCGRLGLPRFGWHSCRHSFTTYGGNSGVPMPVLQSVLGHTSAETTMIYTHPLEEAQRQAVEKLATILFPYVPNLDAPQDGKKVVIQ